MCWVSASIAYPTSQCTGRGSWLCEKVSSLDMRTTSKKFQLVSSSRRSIPVTPRWVTSLTLHLLKGCRMTLCADSTWSKSVLNAVQGDHLASKRLWRPLPRLTWLPAIKSGSSRMRQNPWETPRVLQLRNLCVHSAYDGCANFDFNNVPFRSYANTARQSYADSSCSSDGFDCARAHESRQNCQALRRAARLHWRTPK